MMILPTSITSGNSFWISILNTGGGSLQIKKPVKDSDWHGQSVFIISVRLSSLIDSYIESNAVSLVDRFTSANFYYF